MGMGFYSYDSDGDRSTGLGREHDWSRNGGTADAEPYYIGVASHPQAQLISLRMIAPGLVPDVCAEHQKRDALAKLNQHFVVAVNPLFEAVNLLVQKTKEKQIGNVKLARERVFSDCFTTSFPQGAKSGADAKLYLGFILPAEEDGSLFGLSLLRGNSAAQASIPIRLNAVKNREKYLFTLGLADFLWAIGELITGIKTKPEMSVLLANPLMFLNEGFMPKPV